MTDTSDYPHVRTLDQEVIIRLSECGPVGILTAREAVRLLLRLDCAIRALEDGMAEGVTA